MSISELKDLLNPYEGPNRAHRRFRQEFKYLNALYYLILSGKDILREHLQLQMAQADRDAAATRSTDGYALTIVTNVISKTQFQGISVAKPDAETMLRDFDGFIDLLNRHSIIAAHRAIVDFATDLLIELEEEESRITIAPSVNRDLHQRRLQPSKLAEQFERINEPIHEDSNQMQRLRLLGEMRNLLEHNEGRERNDVL